MKKVLIIAYHFPPEEGSCSDKNIKIIKVLKDAGLKVEVLTVGESSNEEYYENVPIFRAKGGIFHRKKNIGECNNLTDVCTKGEVKAHIKAFVQKKIVPDSIIDWYPNVIRWSKNNLERMKNYGVILSISSPYSVHLISNHLSKKYNIPYICSYGDPWIYEPARKRGKLRYKFEYQLEKKIVTEASKILVITDYNRKKYMSLYGISEDKIDTFNIGYDSHMLKERKVYREEKIRFIYGGSLNPIHRNVVPFIHAVHSLEGIIVDIYNQDYPELKPIIEKLGISKKINVKNLISSSKFTDELYNSDVLLLFGNKTVFQVPGKLFDYISTGAHVLYIKNNMGIDDASEHILREYGNVTIVDNNVESILLSLKDICNKYRKKTLNSVCNKDEYEAHITMKSIVEAVRSVLI